MFEWLYNVSKKLPQVKGPKTILSSKQKLMWTLAVLLTYYILYNVTAIGVKEHAGLADIFQILTASRQGSLLALGIGPIVIASIFIQLFAGGGLLDIDMGTPETQKKILGAQTTLAIILAAIEGIAFTSGYAHQGMLTVGGTIGITTVALQLILGAIIIIYMDQIVTKYGIGTGIGLFIAAGVSYSVIMGAMYTVFGSGGVIDVVAEGGIEGLTTAFIQILPFISTIVVFWVVVYGEMAKVKLPLSIPGSNRPLELPFFFVSNLPVIFAAALLINVMLFAQALIHKPLGPGGKPTWLHYLGGLLYLTTPVHAGLNIPQYLTNLTSGITPILGLPEWVHALVYLVTLAILSIYFGKFWVEMSPQQNPEELAELLSQQNIAIRGHRTDKRFLKMKLEQYIWPLTVTGSLAVGLLAGFANLLGAYGTGTGILLTVEILYRMMGEIKQTLDIHYPGLSKMLFGRGNI